MVVNDSNKQRAVDAGILPVLVNMLNSNDVKEHFNAANTLFTLSFDTNVKDAILKEPGCMEALRKATISEDKGVAKQASGAIWKITGLADKFRIKSKKILNDDRFSISPYF